jgi:uncharacterized protein
MVVVELSYTDSPGRLALRPRHREILGELYEDGEVALAGPFDDGAGAIVVFSTDRARAEEVLASDPYYSAEGVRIVSIRELSPLFPRERTDARTDTD